MGTFPFLQCDHNLQDDHFVTVGGGGGGGGVLHQKQNNQKVGAEGWEGFQNGWLCNMLIQSHSGTCFKDDG